MKELPSFLTSYRPPHVSEETWRSLSLQLKHKLDGYIPAQGVVDPKKRFFNNYAILTQTLVELFAEQQEDVAGAIMQGFLDCVQLTSQTLRSSTGRDLWMQMSIQNGSMQSLHAKQQQGSVALGQWLINQGHLPHLHRDNENDDVLDYLLLYGMQKQTLLIDLIANSTPASWWMDKKSQYDQTHHGSMGINKNMIMQILNAKELEMAVGDSGVKAPARKI